MLAVGGSASVRATLFHHLSRANRFVNRTTERLATAQRINRASDDPAGLIASEQLRSELTDIGSRFRVNSALRHQNRVAQSRLSSESALLRDLRGLAIQVSGDTASSDEKAAIQLQADASIDALSRIASAAGRTLSPELIDLRSGGSANLVDGDAGAAVEKIDQALSDNLDARIRAGVYEKYTLDVDQRLGEAQEAAIASSLSAIADADYASESSNLVKGGILAEASLRTLALSQQIHRQQALAIFDRLF